MNGNGIRDLLQSKKNKTTTDTIRFDTRADDMKRIIEYGKSKSGRDSSDSYESFEAPMLQKECHYELSVDGVRIVMYGTLDEAQNKLHEMTYKNGCAG